MTDVQNIKVVLLNVLQNELRTLVSLKRELDVKAKQELTELAKHHNSILLRIVNRRRSLTQETIEEIGDLMK